VIVASQGIFLCYDFCQLNFLSQKSILHKEEEEFIEKISRKGA